MTLKPANDSSSKAETTKAGSHYCELMFISTPRAAFLPLDNVVEFRYCLEGYEAAAEMSEPQSLSGWEGGHAPALCYRATRLAYRAFNSFS
jgi:hypothetical protein